MDEENKSSEFTSATPTSAKKMNPIVIVGVVLVVAVIGYFAVTMMGDKTKDSMEVVDSMDSGNKIKVVSGSTQEAMTDSTAMDVAVVKVEGGSFYFKPNVIKAKLGDTVKVELTAVSMQHDFVIDELGVRSDVVPSGKKTTVQFVADTIGEFEFYCSVGNHKQQGMVGTLVVEQ